MSGLTEGGNCYTIKKISYYIAEELSVVIELKQVTKIFPTADGAFPALEGIDLTIRDGDIFGIVGMSGAGKSTLVRRTSAHRR